MNINKCVFLFSMSEKKLEAEAAVDLMRVQYERICNDEEKRQGLIIVEARYGNFQTEEGDEGNNIERYLLQIYIFY